MVTKQNSFFLYSFIIFLLLFYVGEGKTQSNWSLRSNIGYGLNYNHSTYNPSAPDFYIYKKAYTQNTTFFEASYQLNRKWQLRLGWRYNPLVVRYLVEEKENRVNRSLHFLELSAFRRILNLDKLKLYFGIGISKGLIDPYTFNLRNENSLTNINLPNDHILSLQIDKSIRSITLFPLSMEVQKKISSRWLFYTKVSANVNIANSKIRLRGVESVDNGLLHHNWTSNSGMGLYSSIGLQYDIFSKIISDNLMKRWKPRLFLGSIINAGYALTPLLISTPNMNFERKNSSALSYGFSVGVEFDQKWSIEFQFRNRDLTNRYILNDSYFYGVSFHVLQSGSYTNCYTLSIGRIKNLNRVKNIRIQGKIGFGIISQDDNSNFYGAQYYSQQGVHNRLTVSIERNLYHTPYFQPSLHFEHLMGSRIRAGINIEGVYTPWKISKKESHISHYASNSVDVIEYPIKLKYNNIVFGVSLSYYFGRISP